MPLFIINVHSTSSKGESAADEQRKAALDKVINNFLIIYVLFHPPTTHPCVRVCVTRSV